jgi:hypothetical protein
VGLRTAKKQIMQKRYGPNTYLWAHEKAVSNEAESIRSQDFPILRSLGILLYGVPSLQIITLNASIDSSNSYVNRIRADVAELFSPSE